MNYSYTTTASTTSTVSGVTLLIVYLGMLALIVVMIAAMWRVFKKAGQPGWAAIVPVYNSYILAQIIGKPDWWFLLFFVPFVNIYAYIVLAIELAKVFGKSLAFGIIGLLLFSPIGYLMLGFGKAAYTAPTGAMPASGPAATPPAAPMPPTTPTPPPAAPTPPPAA